MDREDIRKGHTIFVDKEGNTVQISEEVIATIAAMSIRDVKGVIAAGGNVRKGLMEKFGWEDLAKGVAVEVTEDGVIVNVAISVEFDKKIMAVSAEVQDKIKCTIKDMTDLDVIAVNVRVVDVKADIEN
ncbi:MAG: Asp23/Gls24 family envelope stress response protein [Lachnospiraceae bacterium]